MFSSMSTISGLSKYQKKSTAAPVDLKLKYYYRFNSADVSGTTAKNVATNTYDLTLVGSNPINNTSGRSALLISPTNIAYLTSGNNIYSSPNAQTWAVKFYVTSSLVNGGTTGAFMNLMVVYPSARSDNNIPFFLQGYWSDGYKPNNCPLVIRWFIYTANIYDFILTTDLTLNTWHSAAISVSGNVYRAYLDGVEKVSKTVTGGSLSTNNNNVIQFGQESSSGNANYRWNGYIDEFRVYNSTLSSTQINNLHLYDDTVAPTTPVPTNQIIHFKGNVNDITGTTTVKNYGSITGDGSFATNTTLSNTPNAGILINTTSYKVGNGSLDLSSGSYIKMPNVILSNAGFSFCGWIKTTDALLNTWSRIFDIKVDETAGTSRILMMCPTQTTFQFATQIPGGGLNVAGSFSGLSTTVWNHISWTLTTSGVSKYYVNREYTGTFSTALFPNTTTPYDWSLIGASSGYSNPWFKGYLDDIQMFDRVLSDEEITAIFYNTI